MYENECKYRECRKTTDMFASDEESEEYSFNKDSSNESLGKLLKKFKTKFLSTHADMDEFSDNISEKLDLCNEELNTADSNLVTTCQPKNNPCLRKNQYSLSSACHCDQWRNIAHDQLHNLDIQPYVYKLAEVKLLEDRILQNHNENSVLSPGEFKRTVSGMQPSSSLKSTIQHEYDLKELNLSITSVVTSQSQNFPPKVESLDPNCSAKFLDKAGMQSWKENIDPNGILQMDVDSFLMESNGNSFSNNKHTVPTSVSETPRSSLSSKCFRHAQTSPRQARFDDSDSSTDEHCLTKSSKRRKHRNRRMGILFRLSDEDLRKSNSDLFGRTADEEECLFIKRKVLFLNACAANKTVKSDRILKKITSKNLNIDKKFNQISAENVKSSMESRRVSRKRLISRDEIPSAEKEKNEKVCKKLKQNKPFIQKYEFQCFSSEQHKVA